MSEMISLYLGKTSTGYFMEQVIVILVLFTFGYVVNLCLCRGDVDMLEVLLAFPTGISLYSLTSFMLLVTGSPFNRISVTGICVLIAAICLLVTAGSKKRAYKGGASGKKLIIYLITVLCIAVISTSGILSVSVSNDSLYYYWMYPRALVTYGFLRPQFDVFLTDVGQTSATLNTLPFMYGFNEGFGIQTFLSINTVFAAVYALYRNAIARLEKKKAYIATVLLSALLICTQPILIMFKWIMSNGYFMCFMFIVVYAAYVFDRKRDTDNTVDMGGRMVILGILLLQMSMLRMEGIMVTLVLVICFSTLKYRNTELFCAFLLPEFVCALAYSFWVFVISNVDAPYTFLTPKKALLQLAAIIAVSVYVMIFRGRRFDPVGKNMKVILPLVILAANLVLFLMNKTLFLENLSAFARNISNRSGWGLFPMCIIGVYVLLFIVKFKKEEKGVGMTYWDMCFVCYLLATLAVCFAREDALRESIGDSGNRVLMQVSLLAFYALADHLIGLMDTDRKAVTGS